MPKVVSIGVESGFTLSAEDSKRFMEVGIHVVLSSDDASLMKNDFGIVQMIVAPRKKEGDAIAISDLSRKPGKALVVDQRSTSCRFDS